MPDEEHPESPIEQDAKTAEKQPEPPTEQDVPTAEEQPAAPTDEDVTAPERSGGRVFSPYGIASAVLGLLSVAAIVLGVITWSQHRDHVDERAYQNHVMNTAGTWASVLINLNAGNVDAAMARLREKSTGQLNANFDSVLQPYRDRALALKTRSTGRIESLAVERLHHDADSTPGTTPSTTPNKSAAGSRTSTVTVVAISLTESQDGKPRGLRYTLQLDVSDVNGKLLISEMRPIR